jgi:uncharacterized protein YukE
LGLPQIWCKKSGFEYVQWQEKKEQEMEKLQGKLFDEN